jgi:hypothetical protein
VIAVAGRKRPPLRDPRWCALKAAVEAMQRKTGKMSLAITDLEEAMADGKRPLAAMRRDLATGARLRLASTFWTEHLIDFSTGAVAIYRRRKGEPRRFGMFAHHNEDRVDGAAYFVWGPDLDKLLGAAPVAATTAVSPPPAPARRKPGKQPTQDWPTHVEREVNRLTSAGQKVPTAAKLAQYCEDTLGYQPDVSAVQKLLRKLLG